MVCALPKDGVYVLFTWCEKQRKFSVAIFEGSWVFVNAFQ
jgi:hypothetical protein